MTQPYTEHDCLWENDERCDHVLIIDFIINNDLIWYDERCEHLMCDDVITNNDLIAFFTTQYYAGGHYFITSSVS